MHRCETRRLFVLSTSPDGKRLVWTTDGEGVSQVYMMVVCPALLQGMVTEECLPQMGENAAKAPLYVLLWWLVVKPIRQRTVVCRYAVQ